MNEDETRAIPASEQPTRTIPIDDRDDAPTRAFDAAPPAGDDQPTATMPAAEPEAQTDTVPIDTMPTDTVPIDSVPVTAAPVDPAPADADAETQAFPADDDATRQVPLYSTAPPVAAAPQDPAPPTYVQVPSEPYRERPVIRKTGPSVATIIFGVLLILIGVLVFVLGLGFPTRILPGLGMSADPRVIIAIVCGVFGGILVLVSVVWAVMRIIRSRHDDDGDADDTRS